MKTNTHTLYAFENCSDRWYRYPVADGDITGKRFAVTEEEVEAARGTDGVEVNPKEEVEDYITDEFPF